MGLFKNLKEGLAGAMTPPTQEEMDAILAKLPPDKRDELAANWAKGNQNVADSQAIFEEERERRIGIKVLDGPAGAYLYGRIEELEGPQDINRRMREEGAGSVGKGMLGAVAADLEEGARQFRTGGKVDEVTDPEARARVSAEHRAARDAARGPYLAAAVPPITISRLATRGATQIEEGVTNMGPKQPCADGQDRGRIHGAEHIVVSYCDSPGYAEGRVRWAAYQEEVLQAHLERGIATRRPVENAFGTTSDSSLIRAGATLLRGAERISTIGERKPPPPYRYCWPPVA